MAPLLILQFLTVLKCVFKCVAIVRKKEYNVPIEV